MSGLPLPPTNLSVNAPSTTSLTFTWDPPVQGSGQSITGYLLSIQSDPSFYRIYYTNTSFTVINLNPSTEYTASIQSTNDNFETFSESVSFSPIYPGQTVPNPPSTCSAQRVSNTSALVSWTPPTPFIGPQVQWIVIESVSSNPGDPVRAVSADPFRQTNELLCGLNPLSTYTFTVYAVNTLGYSSPINTNSVTLFQPNTLPGCMMWLDASDTNTVLINDQGTIATWVDKSDSARHATGHGQTYTGSSIQFTNNSMTISCPSLPRQTVFLVAKPSSAQATRYLYDELNGSSVPSIISNYTSTWMEYFNGTDRATFTPTPSACFLAAFAFSQGETVKGYYNSSTPIFTIPQTQINTFPVEYSHIGSDQAIDAQICEVIFYNGILAQTDLDTLVGYLQRKWGC